jgi:hypothetical protein
MNYEDKEMSYYVANEARHNNGYYKCKALRQQVMERKEMHKLTEDWVDNLIRWDSDFKEAQLQDCVFNLKRYEELISNKIDILTRERDELNNQTHERVSERSHYGFK